MMDLTDMRPDLFAVIGLSLLVAILLPVTVSAHRIEAIDEYVDISKTPLNTIKLVISGISPDLIIP